MEGRVGGDGKVIVMTTGINGGKASGTMSITFNGDAFEIHGILRCGDVSHNDTWTSH
jgi:hypothetical protein